jgi:hypothetical protein
MFALAAHNWDVETWALDADRSFPTGPVCSRFVEGSFKDYNDVYAFGKQVDVLTIEIEHVNTDALLRLEAEGVKVHPAPAALNLIKDKGLQKQFYQQHGLPTSDFRLFESGEAIRAALRSGQIQYPFVQKSRTAGYDGKGVAVLKSEADLPLLLPDASGRNWPWSLRGTKTARCGPSRRWRWRSTRWPTSWSSSSAPPTSGRRWSGPPNNWRWIPFQLSAPVGCWPWSCS